MPNRILREGILTSERVNQLNPETEVFYRRLMSVIDDFARYYAKPALLRAACFPLRLDKVTDADICRWLSELQSARLIVLYSVDGKDYFELIDFRQQMRAKASKFPEPTTDAMQARIKCVADAKQPIADAHLDGGGVGGASEVGFELTVANATESTPSALTEKIPFQEIVNLYNATMVNLPKVLEVTPKRKTLMRSAWNANPKRKTLTFWKQYFEECQDDNFCNGTGPYTGGHQNWKPNFDYLMRGEVITRMYEKAMS